MRVDKLIGILRVAIVVALVLLLCAAAGALEDPPEENRAAMTAATVAAAEEYARVMERNGCREAAQYASDITFEEVIKQWEQ